MSAYSASFEVQVGVPYALTLPKAGSYYITCQNSNAILSVSPYEGGGEVVTESKSSLEILSKEDNQTFYIIGQIGDSTIETLNCIVNDFLVQGASVMSGGGGGSGNTYNVALPQCMIIPAGVEPTPELIPSGCIGLRIIQ